MTNEEAIERVRALGLHEAVMATLFLLVAKKGGVTVTASGRPNRTDDERIADTEAILLVALLTLRTNPERVLTGERVQVSGLTGPSND